MPTKTPKTTRAAKKFPMGAKAAFVRANPNVTAPELVQLAKKQGMPVTLGHVYNIRKQDGAAMNGAAMNGAAMNGAAMNGTSTRGRAHANGAGELSSEKQFEMMVLRVGFERAESVIERLKAIANS